MKRSLVTIAAAVAVTAAMAMGTSQAVADDDWGVPQQEQRASGQEPEPASGAFTPQIIGGDDATEKYPFHASMQWKDHVAHPRPHRCGGALITPTWVLTAAHCVGNVSNGELRDPKEFEIVVGSNNNTTGTFIDAVEFRKHPDWFFKFDEIGWGADIGLIKLAKPAPVNPGHIARPGPVGSAARLIGWGRTVVDDPDSMQQEVRQLDTTVRTLAECQVGSEFDAVAGDICAGGPEGTSACAGDSGSPLLRKISGQWHLIGVASRIADLPGEPPCAIPGRPDVYTSIIDYAGWIKQQIWEPGSEN